MDRIEKCDHSPDKETGIGPDTDSGSSDGLKDLGQANLQKRYRPGTAGRVSGAKRAMPEFLEMGLEAQKRMVNFIDKFVEEKELVNYIQRTDICLGIFGQTEKALRVIPCKVYNCL